MKAVTFIRHAKSERERDNNGDFDRGLSERGKSESTRMGKILGTMLPAPEFILSSPARRARETFSLLKTGVEAMHGTVLPDPEEHDILYLADGDTLWDLCYSAFMEVNELWVCGHNPGISEAVSALSGLALHDIPTLGAARIIFDEVMPSFSVGELVFYDTPKNHR